MSKKILSLAFAGLIAASAALTTSPSFADDAPRANIVQLGDSYSAGNGTNDYSPTNARCYRSPYNYGQLTANALPADYTNAACSGAVSADIANPQTVRTTFAVRSFPIVAGSVQEAEGAFLDRAAQEQICGKTSSAENTWKMTLKKVIVHPKSVYGRVSCEERVPAQINAVTPNTDMVFMTIGGNDGNIQNIAIQCMVLRTEKGCRASMDFAWNVINTFDEKMDNVLASIDKASNSHAYVYLLGYPHLLNTTTYKVGTYDFGADLDKMQNELNAMQQRAIDRQNATTGDTRFHFVSTKEVFAGHGYNPYFLGDQKDSWLVPPFSSFDVFGYMHPTAQGWAAEARILTERVQETYGQ